MLTYFNNINNNYIYNNNIFNTYDLGSCQTTRSRLVIGYGYTIFSR